MKAARGEGFFYFRGVRRGEESDGRKNHLGRRAGAENPKYNAVEWGSASGGVRR